MGVVGVVVAIACFFTVSVSTQGTTQCCPNGWMIFQGSCYLFQGTNQSFIGAVADCQTKDAYLVNVGSVQEDLFLRDILKRLPAGYYWIGLSDAENEGTWSWVNTGAVATYTDWSPGEPNTFQGTNEDCAAFQNDLDYHWSDKYCLSNLPFICERPTHAH